MKNSILKVCLGLGIMLGIFGTTDVYCAYAAETEVSQYDEQEPMWIPSDEIRDEDEVFTPDSTPPELESGWVEDEKGIRYRYSDGQYAKSGWLRESEDWFYLDSDGYRVADRWIGDYYLKSDGRMAVSEWVEDGLYYVDEQGIYRRGWLWLNRTWYYLDSWGAKQTGWIYINNVWYYADPETGAIWEERWLDDTYYFRAGGYMSTGWEWVDDTYYFFYSNGAKASNEWIGDYYLKLDGRMAVSEWVENGIYYVDGQGSYWRGWLWLDGTWYYMDRWGAKQRGWIYVNGEWYYMDSDGKMVTGWLELGSWYYLNPYSGTMVTGWHMVDGTWYYFNRNGEWSDYTFLGITRDQIVTELEAHRYDNYYLGTRYGGLSLSTGLTDPCMHPNGSPRWDGYIGLNCTGFVAFVIQKIGGNLNEIAAMGRIGSYVNACNWIDYAKKYATYYVYNSISELLTSGNAVKGDILYCEPDWSKRGADCHIGIYWGDYPGHNQFWHQVDINKISHIYAGTLQVRYYIIKTGP